MEKTGWVDVAGNLALDATNIVTSGTGLVTSVVRPGQWKLFRHVSSDYVPAYKAMTKTGLATTTVTASASAAATICRYHAK